MHIPIDATRRPYIYFSKDLKKMLIQYDGDFVADIYELCTLTDDTVISKEKYGNITTWS